VLRERWAAILSSGDEQLQSDKRSLAKRAKNGEVLESLTISEDLTTSAGHSTTVNVRIRVQVQGQRHHRRPQLRLRLAKGPQQHVNQIGQCCFRRPPTSNRLFMSVLRIGIGHISTSYHIRSGDVSVGGRKPGEGDDGDVSVGHRKPGEGDWDGNYFSNSKKNPCKNTRLSIFEFFFRKPRDRRSIPAGSDGL